MSFFETVLRLFDSKMERPEMYGWFHLLSLAITAAVIVYLYFRHKNDSPKRIRSVLLWVSATTVILEIYKQINYSFGYGADGITFDYQWYAFPFQFCSMPMYVGLLAGLTKNGRLHRALVSFLSTYAIFAGICVMLYPDTIYTQTIGINLQTTFCHCTMIILGIYLYFTGYVKAEHKTIARAIPVFAIAVSIAAILNEIAHFSGLLKSETFNMFFISRHCAPSLPVYSLVQATVPFPFCLVIYVGAFSLAAYIILLTAILIKKIASRKAI